MLKGALLRNVTLCPQQLARLPLSHWAHSTGGFPVALLAVAEGNMLEVLGHVQLNCSSGNISSREINVTLSDLCVAPHLQVSPPLPTFPKQCKSVTIYSVVASALQSSVLSTATCHKSSVTRHASRCEYSAPPLFAPFSSVRAILWLQPPPAAPASAALSACSRP
jgi:hypothetical protein